MQTYKPVYKLDSKGKLRVYFIERDEEKYRMVTGIHQGKEVRSKWTTAKAKNVGKSNETTPEVQAKTEVEARFTKKRNEGYFDSIEEANSNPDGNFLNVMLASEEEKVIAKYKAFPQIADPKLDGMRMANGIRVIFNSDGIQAISRKGKEILTAGHIVEELKPFFNRHPDVVLDGELYNHDYKEDFNTLMSIARQMKPTEDDLRIARENLQFHVYDCYLWNDSKITAFERKTLLMKHLPTSDKVRLVEFKVVNNQKELDAVKEQNLIDGYEGTITRGYNSVYENKRSRWLLKHKDFTTEEFKVVAILAGKGNRSGIAGTVQVMVGDQIVGCGIRGSHNYCEKLLKNKDSYIGTQATVRHFGPTPDGSLRFPVCIDINRPD